MKRFFATLCLLLLAPGCGDEAGVPAAAKALRQALTADLVRVMPWMANVQSTLIYVLTPGSSAAPDVLLTPDLSAGAPPHAFIIGGTLDGDGDLFMETTVNGRAVFASDPGSTFTSVSGQLEIAVNVPLLGNVYQSTVDYVMSASQIELSGSVMFSNPLAGSATTVTVPAGAPLVVKPATGGADARANACGFSAQGDAGFSVEASTGTYRTTAVFESSDPLVSLTQSTFEDGAGQTLNLPDSSTGLGCGDDGELADWEATFDVTWYCLPYESGQYQTTATVSGSTLTFDDDDEPEDMSAAPIGSSPRAVRGFFLDGPDGTRYREDLNRTLQHGGGFSEFSVWQFFEGPLTGSGGVCASTAQRVN